MLSNSDYINLLKEIYQNGVYLAALYPDDSLQIKDIRYCLNIIGDASDFVEVFRDGSDFEYLQHAALRSFQIAANRSPQLANDRSDRKFAQRIFEKVAMLAQDTPPPPIKNWRKAVLEAYLVLCHDWGLYTKHTEVEKLINQYIISENHIDLNRGDKHRLDFYWRAWRDLTHDTLSEESKLVIEWNERLLRFQIHPKLNSESKLINLKYLKKYFK